MNAISRRRPKLENTLPEGDAPADAYQHSRNLQNDRIHDAAKSQREWKRLSSCLMLLLMGSVAGNVYQGTTSKMIPYAVPIDTFGNALAGRLLTRALPPGSAEMEAVARSVISGARTRYADGNAMKANIYDVYAHTVSGSPAAAMLNNYFTRDGGGIDPFEEAKTTLRTLDQIHAYPSPASDAGGELRSYLVEWVETEVNRTDGDKRGAPRSWFATVALRVSPPTTQLEAEKNPQGIYVYQIDWKQR